MKISNLSFLFLMLAASCVTKNTNELTHNNPTPDSIVLVFVNFPSQYTIKLNDTQGNAYTPAIPEVRYYDDHLIQRVLKPQPGTTDTLHIACSRRFIEFQHSVKGSDNFEYVFQKGDTVVFTYHEKVPTARVTNRITSDFEINYDLRQREIICSNDYPAFTKVLAPFLFITYNSNYIGKEGERSGVLGQLDKIRREAQLQFKKEATQERKLLDSLLNKTVISQETFEWLNQKITVKENTVNVYNDNLSRAEIKEISSAIPDSALYHHVYRNFLANIRSNYYERKNKRIISSNSNLPDYQVVYDSILASNLLTQQAKQVLLFETSDLLISANGATNINKHLNRIKTEMKDTVLISFLMDKYGLRKPITNDLELANKEGAVTTLNTIIKENAGNIVYIDLWASWCAPCIKEFPASANLTKKLSEKNVKFIYLSFDDDRAKWMASAEKYNLPEQYSYLVQNKKTSEFLEQINLNTIPRYLLFDKNGNLKNSNAPRPSNAETLQLLENLWLSK